MNNKQNVINIVDVRTPEEFQSGNAQGSINIPLNQLFDNIDRLKALNGTIVLCCASGMRSGSALSALMQHGFNNVVNAGPWYEAENYAASIK